MDHGCPTAPRQRFGQTAAVRPSCARLRNQGAHRHNASGRPGLRQFPEFLAELLARHIAARGIGVDQPEELLFVAPSGGPVRATNFRNRVWAPAVKAAGLAGQGLTLHHLRHSAVGYLVDASAPLPVMQQRMGNASIRTTLDVYGHVLPSTDRAATKHLQELFTTERAASPERSVGD
ncbi:MAG: tyrosine-type recombinase/integrase [Acidimicrobiales bacterium]